MLRKCLGTVVAAVAVANAAGPPALPLLDWNACPFEGCAYRRWTALEQVNVYDTWKQGRKRIAQLSKGDAVVALTGVVITVRPGVIRMDRDLPEQTLKRGDTILTYAYRGEGLSAAWFHGRYYSEFDISFVKWLDGSGCGGKHCAGTYVDVGQKLWWAQVQLSSRRIGWVNMSLAKFDGIDRLAFLLRESPAGRACASFRAKARLAPGSGSRLDPELRLSSATLRTT
jgi:hypothetical protein